MIHHYHTQAKFREFSKISFLTLNCHFPQIPGIQPNHTINSLLPHWYLGMTPKTDKQSDNMYRSAYPKETSDGAKNKSVLDSKNRFPEQFWFSMKSPGVKSQPFPDHFSKFKIRRHPSSIPVESKSSEIASDLGQDQFGHSSVGQYFRTSYSTSLFVSRLASFVSASFPFSLSNQQQKGKSSA